MDARDTKSERSGGGGAVSEEEGAARPGHLGFVAHEIRNPLSTALWTAEMLARMDMAERGGARGEKLSAMCLRAVSRVRQLVEDHLLCERLDAGGLPLRIESVGAREALDAVLEKRPAEAASGDADPSLGVAVDRGLLERALEALVAVAGHGGARVSVTVRGADGQVEFLVEGKPADAAALADPVKGSPSDPSGRALAVPLARRLASVLGGALAVRGSGWLLTVPRAQAYTSRPPRP
jgi:signal transduction histidine kinase